jgi:hypothetical protein
VSVCVLDCVMALWGGWFFLKSHSNTQRLHHMWRGMGWAGGKGSATHDPVHCAEASDDPTQAQLHLSVHHQRPHRPHRLLCRQHLWSRGLRRGRDSGQGQGRGWRREAPLLPQTTKPPSLSEQGTRHTHKNTQAWEAREGPGRERESDRMGRVYGHHAACSRHKGHARGLSTRCRPYPAWPRPEHADTITYGEYRESTQDRGHPHVRCVNRAQAHEASAEHGVQEKLADVGIGNRASQARPALGEGACEEACDLGTTASGADAGAGAGGGANADTGAVTDKLAPPLIDSRFADITAGDAAGADGGLAATDKGIKRTGEGLPRASVDAGPDTGPGTGTAVTAGLHWGGADGATGTGTGPVPTPQPLGVTAEAGRSSGVKPPGRATLPLPDDAEGLGFGLVPSPTAPLDPRMVGPWEKGEVRAASAAAPMAPALPPPPTPLPALPLPPRRSSARITPPAPPPPARMSSPPPTELDCALVGAWPLPKEEVTG